MVYVGAYLQFSLRRRVFVHILPLFHIMPLFKIDFLGNRCIDLQKLNCWDMYYYTIYILRNKKQQFRLFINAEKGGQKRLLSYVVLCMAAILDLVNGRHYKGLYSDSLKKYINLSIYNPDIICPHMGQLLTVSFVLV